jgi:nitroreductase
MKVKNQILRALFLILSISLAISAVNAQTESTESSKSNPKQEVKKTNNNAQMSDIWYVIHNRRSVRSFKPDPIPDPKIKKIIDAARMAPTSGNQQPWKFLVIRDKKLINQMMEACVNESLSRYGANPSSETKEQYEQKVRKALSTGYFSAPVFIVVLTDNNSKYPDYNHWDGPLAAGYMMLAARALGYGTVFITDAISESVTKEVLQIPDNYTRVCITPLGVPVKWPATPPKKNLNEMISYDKL